MRTATLSMSIIALVLTRVASAQTDSIAARYLLGATTISVFRKPDQQRMPAAVVVMDSAVKGRFNESSIVAAANTLPGVRLEERSPGSLRLAVRGSSLRAPFGVRNVKVYYNDIPFTDPGGQTYLNALGYYNIDNLVVNKGPAGAVYGSGNGGAAFLSSVDEHAAPGLRLRVNGGSYSSSNTLAELRRGGDSSGANLVVRYQRRRSQGFREQSALKQDVASVDSRLWDRAAASWSAHFLLSHLHYETPGALTRAEYEADPLQARPKTAAAPGAESAHAAVRQTYGFAGLRWKETYAPGIVQTTTAYVAGMVFRNPTIRNYSRSNDAHAGGRTEIVLDRDLAGLHAQWILGAEFQSGLSAIRTYDNRAGEPDTLRFDDENTSSTGFGFTQLTVNAKRWTIQGGLSYNRAGVRIVRFSEVPVREYRREFTNGLVPRIALGYSVSNALSLHAIFSKGFSPPSTGELSPSGGAINTTLAAERGTNYELGLRFAGPTGKIRANVQVFRFALQDAIVLRKNAAGGDEYLNAGGTLQQGAEASVRWSIIELARMPLSFWASVAVYDFRYREFVQGGNDYSGNDLPGVPPQTISAGFDAGRSTGWYAGINGYYSAEVQLLDANTQAAPSFLLLGGRIGYRKAWRGRVLEVYAGADNLLDERYTLGPDINAFGGRYYNASPGRNFFAGLGIDWPTRR